MHPTEEAVTYMRRCLQLAALGRGFVSPNPMVGAVLVHNGEIIAEGWHRVYGGAHAEFNCLIQLATADRRLLRDSTMYVSLEPCAHFGKTPPCADRIVAEGIGRVVVGMRDPFAAVDGKGIEKMRAAGIAVEVGVMERACRRLNRAFLTFHQHKRPYVILKWAATADGLLSGGGEQRLLISNRLSNIRVHRLRAQSDAILVGRHTAEADDPQLTARLWPGQSPLRMVLDSGLRLPGHLKLLSDGQPTVIFNQRHGGKQGPLVHHLLTQHQPVIPQIFAYCYDHGLQTLLVEGGAVTLQSFLDSGLWDEAQIITNTGLRAGKGIAAPSMQGLAPNHSHWLYGDRWDIYYNEAHGLL